MIATATPELQNLADGSAFLTVREAATYLRLSVAKLYLLMDAGDLAYAKFDRSRRIPRTALAEYANQRIVAAR
jgi:excisionase family DNA binding protein